MKLFVGKSPTERNKTIAALVLGAMAIFALWLAFGGSIFSRKPTVTVSASPTPKPSASPNANLEAVKMPNEQEIDSTYSARPIDYTPGNFYAPDAGRNIFAFYEPPPPTPYSPTPFITRTPTPLPPASPPPVPYFIVSYVQPQMVYAGSKGFKLEVNGDKFTTDSHIFFNGSELPTTFVSPQKLTADVSSNFIAGEGGRAIIVQTIDGKNSNVVQLSVQAAPRPTFQYIGMISRRHNNNDTAYFQEQGKPTPFGARLNDIVGGRFRLESISADEAVFEDVNLGFKHRLALYRPDIAQTGGGSGQSNPYPQNQMPTLGNPGRMPPNRGFDQSVPNNNLNNLNSPNNPNNQKVPNAQPVTTQPGSIPGIPGRIQIYTPPQPPPPDQKDEDDDGNNR